MKRKSRDAKFSRNVQREFTLETYRHCVRKVRYTDRGLAIRGARIFMNMAADVPAMGAYQCRHCNGWHITKNVANGTMTRRKEKLFLIHHCEEL